VPPAAATAQLLPPAAVAPAGNTALGWLYQPHPHQLASSGPAGGGAYFNATPQWPPPPPQPPLLAPYAPLAPPPWPIPTQYLYSRESQQQPPTPLPSLMHQSHPPLPPHPPPHPPALPPSPSQQQHVVIPQPLGPDVAAMRPSALVPLVAAARAKLGAAPYEPLHPLAIAGAGGVGRTAVEPGRVAARLDAFTAVAGALRSLHEELGRRESGLPHRVAADPAAVRGHGAAGLGARHAPGQAPLDDGGGGAAPVDGAFAWATGRDRRSRSCSSSRSRSRSRSRERVGGGGGSGRTEPHGGSGGGGPHYPTPPYYPQTWAAALERRAAAAGYSVGHGGASVDARGSAGGAGGGEVGTAAAAVQGDRDGWGGGFEFAGLGFTGAGAQDS
jgi:hypothetical protein